MRNRIEASETNGEGGMGCGWAKIDPQLWPVDLLPELRAYERNHPPGTPIYNHMNFGGFLIYYTPGLHVFIDDRCELYGDERLLAYDDAETADPGKIDWLGAAIWFRRRPCLNSTAQLLSPLYSGERGN